MKTLTHQETIPPRKNPFELNWNIQRQALARGEGNKAIVMEKPI